MTSLGQKPSENEVDAMIRKADQDGKTKCALGTLCLWNFILEKIVVLFPLFFIFNLFIYKQDKNKKI